VRVPMSCTGRDNTCGEEEDDRTGTSPRLRMLERYASSISCNGPRAVAGAAPQRHPASPCRTPACWWMRVDRSGLSLPDCDCLNALCSSQRDAARPTKRTSTPSDPSMTTKMTNGPALHPSPCSIRTLALTLDHSRSLIEQAEARAEELAGAQGEGEHPRQAGP
jgi:hypothetical protein